MEVAKTCRLMGPPARVVQWDPNWGVDKKRYPHQYAAYPTGYSRIPCPVCLHTLLGIVPTQRDTLLGIVSLGAIPYPVQYAGQHGTHLASLASIMPTRHGTHLASEARRPSKKHANVVMRMILICNAHARPRGLSSVRSQTYLYMSSNRLFVTTPS